MTLRTRLIVAFVALSVVPLGAVTWYSYVNSVQVMEEVATRGADLLAGELRQRMQLITASLSKQVDSLMEMEGEPATVDTGLVAPAPGAEAAAAAALEEEVAQRLGDAAMLLKNVQLRRLPTGRGRQGPGRGGRGRSDEPPASGRRGGGTAAAAPIPGEPATPAPPPASAAPVAASPTAASPPTSPPDTAGASGATPTDVVRQDAAAAAEARITTIDLAAIRRQMFREIVPPDRPFEEMTAAERQRVVAEVNQRLLGIEQGLKIGAAELQKQADEARREAEAKPTTPPPPSPAKPTTRVTRRLAMTGSRLNIRREQNGVVRQIDAEVNMPELLATVFSATPRDRGEIPFAIDPKGRVYAPSPEDRAKIAALGGAVTDPKSRPGTIRLPEWIVVTTAAPIESDLKLGIARPVGGALTDLRATAMRSAGLGIGFILLTLAGIVPLSVGLTRSLSRLNDGVRRIASGDYAARLPVKRQDEVGQLAQSVNQMAEDVERHQRLALQQERLARELELGREIQHEMLPHAPLDLPQVAVHGSAIPAGEVGGDFYNYFELADGQVVLIIGDVSGKGVAAALLMANIQASLRTRLVLGQPLKRLAEEIDRDIQANTPEPVYATLFIATLEPASARLRYVNAGHNPPLVRRRGGQLERLDATGLPIGLLSGRGYAEASVTLAAGDVLFCYTDGCVEALNSHGEMFGMEAIERELQAPGLRSAASILEHMEATLHRFRSSHPADDDATMMVAEVKPEVLRR